MHVHQRFPLSKAGFPEGKMFKPCVLGINYKVPSSIITLLVEFYTQEQRDRTKAQYTCSQYVARI